MNAKSFKPAGYPSVSPYLICPNGPASVAFLVEVFGGSLARRFDRPDGSLMHAEVRIDDTVTVTIAAEDSATRGATPGGSRPMRLSRRRCAGP